MDAKAGAECATSCLRSKEVGSVPIPASEDDDLTVQCEWLWPCDIKVPGGRATWSGLCVKNSRGAWWIWGSGKSRCHQGGSKSSIWPKKEGLHPPCEVGTWREVACQIGTTMGEWWLIKAWSGGAQEALEWRSFLAPVHVSGNMCCQLMLPRNPAHPHLLVLGAIWPENCLVSMGWEHGRGD
jgi:hypothetical protein